MYKNNSERERGRGREREGERENFKRKRPPRANAWTISSGSCQVHAAQTNHNEHV